MNNSKQIALRQYNNLQILEILRKIVQRHPELRFGQLLMVVKAIETETSEDKKGNIATTILDPWNEESDVTAKRIMLEVMEGDAQL